MLTPFTPTTMRKSTFMGLNNPCVGPGPCTYQIPWDPNSSIMAYHYVHGNDGSDLSSGFMSNFVLHMHQTLMDAAFLFLSADEAAYEAVNKFREDRGFPVIPRRASMTWKVQRKRYLQECKKQEGGWCARHPSRHFSSMSIPAVARCKPTTSEHS